MGARIFWGGPRGGPEFFEGHRGGTKIFFTYAKGGGDQKKIWTGDPLPVKNDSSLISGYFVRQTCGSFGDLEGRVHLTWIEHLFDCIGMVASYSLHEGQAVYSAK